MSLARNVFVQTFFTLGSRMLGFVRDLALNSRFGGQGPLMDCWATAQMLPNLFRRLFAEGAFAQGFVPVFASARATDGPVAADRMASHAMAFVPHDRGAGHASSSRSTMPCDHACACCRPIVGDPRYAGDRRR